ncbi:hypothetical protein [Domibacillus indicus]
MEELKTGMCISKMCRHLGIPISTYYRWNKQNQIEASRQAIE